MKYCTKCGCQLLDDAEMCPNCGTSMSVKDNNSNGNNNTISINVNNVNTMNNNITNKNEKEDNSKLSVPLLISLFLIGFIGLQLIATIVALLIQAPLVSFINADFIKAVNGITEGAGDKILYFIDGVMLFSYYFVAFVIFMILIVANKNALSYLKKAFKTNAILEGLVIALSMLGVTIIYGIISSILYPHESNNNQLSLESAFSVAPFLSFFSIVIFAPVCEELTYRAGLFGVIAKKSRIAAYIVTILVFALIHFDFTAKDIINELVNLPSYLIGAGFLCYAYDRKNNIFTSIFAHMFYNGIQFLLMLGMFA